MVRPVVTSSASLGMVDIIGWQHNGLSVIICCTMSRLGIVTYFWWGFKRSAIFESVSEVA